jgi:hypothetical protein
MRTHDKWSGLLGHTLPFCKFDNRAEKGQVLHNQMRKWGPFHAADVLEMREKWLYNFFF